MAALAALSAAFLAHAAVRARVVRSPALHAARRCTTLAANESCKGDSGLVIIDSHNMAYRMYFAMPPLISKTGEPAHATLGFCNRLAKLRDEFPGYRLLAVFDEGAPTRRLSMLPEYKETRQPMPADLRLQMGHIREAAECFGVPTISVNEEEADDLIATAVALARDEGATSVCVVTSDKDMLQLVSPDADDPWSPHAGHPTNVYVWDDRKKLRLDAAQVRERFHGVAPSQLVDMLALVSVDGRAKPAEASTLGQEPPCRGRPRRSPCLWRWPCPVSQVFFLTQALVGDAVDNVPGVPGIGEKTAAKLLLEHGTLETVLAAAATMRPSKRRDALIQYAETARRARELILLDYNVKGVEPHELRGMLPPPPEDLQHLRLFLQRHGFIQLERRFFVAREMILEQPARLRTD